MGPLVKKGATTTVDGRPAFSAEQAERFSELLTQGSTVAAIKLVREVTGWPLAQARKYVRGGGT